jgi:TPR repeat protein
MKKILLLFFALLLVNCTEQLLVDEEISRPVEPDAAGEVSVLMEKARWGDGEAFVKLADCYRDGKEVKQDFISMLVMLSLANEYSGIKRMEDYISSLPTESEYKMVFDAVGEFSRGHHEQALTMAEKLIAHDCSEGYTVKGIVLTEQGKVEEGKSLLELAADKGSDFAGLYLCFPDWHNGKNPDITKLIALSDRMPIVNACLGKIYSGMDDESLKNEKRAAYYYMKADKNACLGRDAARWLLNYHRNGGNLELNERDIKRLEVLAGMKAVEPEIIKHADPKLESAITELLLEDVEEYKRWSKAMVYVVETKTGKIKANVGYELKGKKFTPYTDTFDKEQCEMETGSTYLALLSSGRVSPEYVFDTACGIYGVVRDHNWRRGGYGSISLERALEVRSQVAFTMAKERVWGSNFAEYEAKINSFLAGKPNEAMGILTFYNAVANNGKMVELVSEGEDGVVLQEQIAEPQYIKELQTGLEHCVSQGVMRKAGHLYIKVSACGRTFITHGNHRRMELCGYFPSDDPLYTIMVVLEKEGLPASAGRMCGPIFAQTMDLLVETYQLQPMLTRQYEEVDEVIEVVDNVAVAN